MKFKFKDTKIFWINMDHDVDRRRRMESFFERHSIDATRVSGVNAENAIVGCDKAHLKVFEQSPDHDFIVLEDDSVPTDWFDVNIECELVDVDGLYLGLSLWARKEDFVMENDKLHLARMAYDSYVGSRAEDPFYRSSGPYLNVHPLNENNTRKVTNMLGTHAIYYGTKRMKDRAISALEETLASSAPRFIDTVYAETIQKEQNIYALDKPLFYQTSSAEATNFTLSTHDDDCLRHLREVYGISV